MDIKKGAQCVGSEEQLFVRAHRMYGHMWAVGSAIDAYRRYQRSGDVPLFVKQYLRHLERTYPDDQPDLFI